MELAREAYPDAEYKEEQRQIISFVWRVLSPPKNQRVSRPAQKERHPLFVSGRIAGGSGVGGGTEEDLRSRKEWLFSAVGGKIKEKKG